MTIDAAFIAENWKYFFSMVLFCGYVIADWKIRGSKIKAFDEALVRLNDPENGLVTLLRQELTALNIILKDGREIEKIKGCLGEVKRVVGLLEDRSKVHADHIAQTRNEIEKVRAEVKDEGKERRESLGRVYQALNLKADK